MIGATATADMTIRAGRHVTDPHGLTRIVHIGDSPLAGDLISSEARSRFQKTFGDGGPGWHLPSRPWEFYSHDRIILKASGWKGLSPLLQTPGNKGDYGLQGIAFTSSSTVKNLGLLFDTHDLGETLKGLSVACIGDITASTATEYGLQVNIQPSQATIPALARAIAEHYTPQDTL